MSYRKDNIIMVSYWDIKVVTVVHAKAKEIFTEVFGKNKFDPIDGSVLVSPIMKSVVNFQCTFFISPDGSNERQPESDLGDEARKKFLDWLMSKYEDCYYIEIYCGGDDFEERIVRSSVMDNNKLPNK